MKLFAMYSKKWCAWWIGEQNALSFVPMYGPFSQSELDMSSSVHDFEVLP